MLSKLSHKVFGSDLIKTLDLDVLNATYTALKEKNYVKDLSGYKPDVKCSIANLNKFLDDVCVFYDEIVVFAFDAVSFEYCLSDIIPEINTHNEIGITPLSSVFPTTTAVAWTSAITGEQPAKHGIYGTSFLLEDFQSNYIWMNNSINKNGVRRYLGKDDQLNLLVSHNDTIFEKLKKKGFKSSFYDSYKDSFKLPLFQEITKGANFVEMDKDTPDDLIRNPNALLSHFISKTQMILERNKTSKQLIWNFVDFDLFIHENGYEKLTEEVNWESLFSFWDKYKSDKRLFVFISDHGQIKQEKIETNILKESSECEYLEDHSGGAGRTVYFYPKKNKLMEALNWVKTKVMSSGIILSKNDLRKYKLLHNNPVAINRIGKIIALASDTKFPSTGNKYHSEHGGISSAEMYVPLIVM